MPYRIKRSEKVTEAVRRIALEEIDRARSELRDTDMETAESVHQARKRLKKLRGLLRLIRPALGADRFRKENRLLRDLGRKVAGARDAGLMLETLDALAGDARDRSFNPDDMAALRDALLARRDNRLEGSGEGQDSHMTQVASALDETRSRVAKWNPVRRASPLWDRV